MDQLCVLCEKGSLRNRSFFVEYDPFPVGRGHMLIVPFRHVRTLFDLTSDEWVDLADILERVKEYLAKVFKPDGYNIGVNDGEAAGQTIKHLHIHIIPRYKGDIEDPRGGIRNIKPPLVKW